MNYKNRKLKIGEKLRVFDGSFSKSLSGNVKSINRDNCQPLVTIIAQCAGTKEEHFPVDTVRYPFSFSVSVGYNDTLVRRDEDGEMFYMQSRFLEPVKISYTLFELKEKLGISKHTELVIESEVKIVDYNILSNYVKDYTFAKF